jgi:hypothetical protein
LRATRCLEAISVILSAATSTAEGVVVEADGKAAVSAKVVLVPKEEKRRYRVQFYAITTTDQQGRFELRSLSPGMYKIFAWENI